MTEFKILVLNKNVEIANNLKLAMEKDGFLRLEIDLDF